MKLFDFLSKRERKSNSDFSFLKKKEIDYDDYDDYDYEYDDEDIEDDYYDDYDYE